MPANRSFRKSEWALEDKCYGTPALLKYYIQILVKKLKTTATWFFMQKTGYCLSDDTEHTRAAAGLTFCMTVKDFTRYPEFQRTAMKSSLLCNLVSGSRVASDGNGKMCAFMFIQ
jgi:hypothetical protein